MALPLLDLTPLLLWLLAFALCIGVVYVSKAFFGVTGTVLGKLPIVGGWIDATAHHIEQRITNVFGGLAAKSEARVGASWHAAARLVDRIGHEIAAHAALIATLAQLLPGGGALANLYTLLHNLRNGFGSLVHRIEGIGHDVIGRIHAVERGIGADVLPRIRGLEREINGSVGRDIPGLRAGERTAEREITNLWKWTKAHTLQAGTLAFAGAVAVALARLGMGWLKCNSVSRIGKRLGCRGFGLLEDLLFGVIDVLVIADLCRLTGVMINVAESSVVQDALGGIIGGIDDLLLCQGVTRPDALDGYWTDPPPLQRYSALPGV